ncbi:hypothetical protein BJX68DRAFT_266738 [Aspergillus pseudodeflectus]|uniref:Uncharacterized protein n=1 Tax=Aspergillus pseudodeflectus TaxID=176178 RepID=A0ABR4KE36_9EURO
MPLPMQVSLPLALHLRSPVTYNFFTNEHWKPGEKFEEGRTLNDFFFLDRHSGRGKATVLFAAILRAIFNHPDWSQLHEFFSTRYPEGEESDSDTDASTHPQAAARTLHPFDDSYRDHKPSIVHFRTDLESVNLPKDLPSLLATAGRTSRSGMLGPDPQPAAIGPAISLACGAGAYMDLVYAGQTPGSYHELTSINGSLCGWENGTFRALTTPLADPNPVRKQGGRGRYWAEWAALWRAISDWVYEHDVTALQLGFISSYSHKYRLSDDEDRSFDHFGKVPREFFETDAVSAADAVRDVFAQLAADPVRFQGIEWAYLELDTPERVREGFYSRFGCEGGIDEVSPGALKRCPATVHGAEWEAWLLSIEGGDVVIVETMFQALWAVILLEQLPLDIRILESGILGNYISASQFHHSLSQNQTSHSFLPLHRHTGNTWSFTCLRHTPTTSCPDTSHHPHHTHTHTEQARILHHPYASDLASPFARRRAQRLLVRPNLLRIRRRTGEVAQPLPVLPSSNGVDEGS